MKNLSRGGFVQHLHPSYFEILFPLHLFSFHAQMLGIVLLVKRLYICHATSAESQLA